MVWEDRSRKVCLTRGDIASLCAEDIDWEERTISLERAKVKWRGGPPPIVSIGPEVEKILLGLPPSAPFFPHLHRRLS